MKYLFFALTLISTTAYSSEVKEMACIEYSVNTNNSGFRQVVNKFEIKIWVDSRKIDIYIQNKKNIFGNQWHEFEKWNSIYSGNSNNRVTRYST